MTKFEKESKPAGYQNKLLGAVTQTLRISDE